MKNLGNFNKNGFLIVNLFNKTQIQKFKTKICQNLNRITNADKITTNNLGYYHKIINNDKIHKKVVNAKRRNIKFSKNDIRTISKNYFIQSLTKNFWGHDKFEIKILKSSTKNKSVFRIARPYILSKEDVGGHHIDTHYGGKLRSGKKGLLTIWTPLVGFSKKYCLKMAPGSHLKKHSIKNIKKQKLYMTQVFKTAYAKKFNFKRFNLKEGQAIIFHPNLLHGGSVNLGKKTRISMDFRIFNKH